jgi:hypothetical protein
METNKSGFLSLIALLALAIMGHTTIQGRIIYVDPCAPGFHDGSTWEHAYICLQTALEDAGAGDEIRVAQGLYLPDRHQVKVRTSTGVSINASGDRAETFLLRRVVMKGGYAGYGKPDPNVRDIVVHPSILSGDLLQNDPNLKDLELETLDAFTRNANRSDNSLTVVTVHDTSETTVLDGFIIEAGHCEGGQPYQNAQDLISPVPEPNTDGAGLWISGRPRIVQCVFRRNTTRCPEGRRSGGAAVLNSYSEATFSQCVFRENIAFTEGSVCTGAAVLNVGSDPTFVDCTFIDNVAAGNKTVTADVSPVGGAMANFDSNPTSFTCSFTHNRALRGWGGAVFSDTISAPGFTDCTFEGNSASLGGALYNLSGSQATVTYCAFLQNEVASPATSAGTDDRRGGAIYSDEDCTVTVTNSLFLGNSARVPNHLAGEGAAVYAQGNWILANCVFSGNDALTGAAIHAKLESSSAGLAAINCTFASNGLADSSVISGSGPAVTLANCIFWDEAARVETEVSSGRSSSMRVLHCDVRGGYTGEGNIDANPGFQDPNGPDGVAGTPDDNLRLSLDSPCLDAGDDSFVSYVPETDLDGLPRVALDRIDMGAYEFHGPFNYYVSAADGNDTNSGLTRSEAFTTIQKGIDMARNGCTVLVSPGLYNETINFGGKTITVAGSGGAPVLEAQGDYAVSFYTAEGRDCVLKNFIIQGSDIGIFLTGSSPTIRNVTLTKNAFGITAYGGANPDISNCILWGNIAGDLFDCTATFSCIQQGEPGEGNISEDPLFGDPAGGDYHLFSEGGRYVPEYGLWSFDAVTSPCVDAGDPALDPGAERIPNGGKINMGAFGGTPEASMSLCLPCVAR